MSILRFHELSRLVLLVKVSQESHENDFLILVISRRALTQNEYMEHGWKRRITLHRLSHNLIESVKY